MQYQPNQPGNEVKAQRGLTSEGGAEQPVTEVRRQVRVGGLGNLLFAAEAAHPETPLTPEMKQVDPYSSVAEDLNIPTTKIFGDVAVRAEAVQEATSMRRSDFDLAA